MLSVLTPVTLFGCVQYPDSYDGRLHHLRQGHSVVNVVGACRAPTKFRADGSQMFLLFPSGVIFAT